MFTLGKIASLTGPKPMALAQNPDVIAGGYTQIPDRFYHASASRNALGLVGGIGVKVGAFTAARSVGAGHCVSSG